jgi:hypothetical protein
LFLIYIPGRVNVPVHILPFLVKLEELTSRVEITRSRWSVAELDNAGVMYNFHPVHLGPE